MPKHKNFVPPWYSAARRRRPAGRAARQFRERSCCDFGGLYERQPGLVFCPQTLEQAQAVLRFLFRIDRLQAARGCP